MFAHQRIHQQNKKRAHRMGEHMANTSDKGLLSKIYNELKKLNTNNNQTTQFKNGQRI